MIFSGAGLNILYIYPSAYASKEPIGRHEQHGKTVRFHAPPITAASLQGPFL